jgi:hypothetical protein
MIFSVRFKNSFKDSLLFLQLVHAKESSISLRKAWTAVITFLVPDFYCAAFAVIHFAYQSRQRL